MWKHVSFKAFLKCVKLFGKYCSKMVVLEWFFKTPWFWFHWLWLFSHCFFFCFVFHLYRLSKVSMRPLREDETRIFFEKLAKYIGRNIRFLIDRQDEEHCFRFHNDRVYYCRWWLIFRTSFLPHFSLHVNNFNMLYCIYVLILFFHSASQVQQAVSIPQENLVSIGTCFGKFTKSKKFRLHITCLSYIAQYAKVSLSFI